MLLAELNVYIPLMVFDIDGTDCTATDFMFMSLLLIMMRAVRTAN